MKELESYTDEQLLTELLMRRVSMMDSRGVDKFTPEEKEEIYKVVADGMRKRGEKF